MKIPAWARRIRDSITEDTPLSELHEADHGHFFCRVCGLGKCDNVSPLEPLCVLCFSCSWLYVPKEVNRISELPTNQVRLTVGLLRSLLIRAEESRRMKLKMERAGVKFVDPVVH